jgi:hypothetical protein
LPDGCVSQEPLHSRHRQPHRLWGA